ncbi:TIGR03086 family metal-binding protein [Ornithinimicrobium sp. F0845]|uniref:TIGR03086 family metal-binding protein n=1 Tax=Ornithinimicrobium sp. F0845 TaxID=2926412 RepID=UPI001FF3A3A1|nr:TIGR03086 family metal-binding protein [Ornithinimicrobium sp. F0845]MCK0111563.1 TIGR03086 family metal-binding protein [Ornithinimicrobium sp. F0845]
MNAQQTHDRLATGPAADYRTKAAAISALLDPATEGDWDRPTPCEGWAVRDLVDHLIDTQRSFLTARDLTIDRATDQSPRELWRQHVEAVIDLLEDPDIGPREYDGHFGRTTIGATMAGFYGWDLIVHRWDLARALGADEELSPGELDEIEAAIPGFGEQLYGPGICAQPVEVADDESRQVRVLARLGRDAR